MISPSKPLNTDNMIINAAVPTVIPNTEIAEMILIALVDFLPNRYRLAILKERFIRYALI